MKKLSNKLNFILFYLLWPAAVFGAINDQMIWLWLLLGSILLTSLYFGDGLIKDIKLALLCLCFGMLFEASGEYFGWVKFYDSQQINGWPPMWLAALWFGLGLTFRHANAWLFNGKSWWLVIWLACVPMTYLSAERLGALVIEDWKLMYLCVFTGWSAFIFCLRLAYQVSDRSSDIKRVSHA